MQPQARARVQEQWGPFFGSNDGWLSQDSSARELGLETSFGVLLGLDLIALLLSKRLTPSAMQAQVQEQQQWGPFFGSNGRLKTPQESFFFQRSAFFRCSAWIRIYLDSIGFDSSTLKLQLLRH
jgi:hypothetical protein